MASRPTRAPSQAGKRTSVAKYKREVEIPPGWPDHGAGLVSNLREVRRLLELHDHVSGGARGGAAEGLQVLNSSGVVLVVACWEAFIEDTAKLAVDAILAATGHLKELPECAVEPLARSLKESKNWKVLLQLCGDGWKECVRAESIRRIKAFNTPKSENVRALLKLTIGLEDVVQSWRWPGTKPESAARRLDKLNSLRGDIAHRVESDKSTRKAQLIDALLLVQRLSVLTSNAVREHVWVLTSKYPWPPAQFNAGSAARKRLAQVRARARQVNQALAVLAAEKSRGEPGT